MQERGFSPQTAILLGVAVGLVGGAWVGSKIGGETIFLGIWSGLLAVVGAAAGCWLGYIASKHL